MEEWQPVRIALVVTGGVDRSGRDHVIPAILSLIERLARRHEVAVYALRYHDRPCSYPLLGATVHDLGRPRGLARQCAALLAALRRDGPFDAVHGYWALPAGLVAAAAGRRLGTPSVVTLDSGELVALPDIGYGLQRLWRHRIGVAATLRLATRLTVCTPYMDRLARRHGAIADLIPIGVDSRRFTPAERSDLASDGPPWRLLHVASLNPVKDQPTLLEAFRQLLDRMPQAHLDIAGEDTLAGTIQQHARRLGLDGHVSFHGHQPAEALAAFYRRAHVLVLSSRHEAAGVVTLEAAACGVPTVGTTVGYLADWAPDKAVAVPPRNAAALADAIAAVLSDAPYRHRLAAAARDWTLAHDADWTADQFDRVYREIATGSRR